VPSPLHSPIANIVPPICPTPPACERAGTSSHHHVCIYSCIYIPIHTSTGISLHTQIQVHATYNTCLLTFSFASSMFHKTEVAKHPAIQCRRAQKKNISWHMKQAQCDTILSLPQNTETSISLRIPKLALAMKPLSVLHHRMRRLPA